MFPTIMQVVLQIPLQVEVFKREVSNKMYGPNVYLMGRYFSAMIFTLFYPLIIVALTYWSFGIDNSPTNIFLFLLMALEINLLGGTIGYVIGVSTDDHFTCRIIAN